MSSKLAFPQFALLEQNLQISCHVWDSCESPTQHKMPAYSVVKDPCPRFDRGISLPVRCPHAFSKTIVKKGRRAIKNPASSAGPSRPNVYPDGFARCSTNCYPEFVIDPTMIRSIETLNAPDNHYYSSDE